MTQAEIVLLIGGIVIAVTLAVGIPLSLRSEKKNKDKRYICEDDFPDCEPETKSFHAEVTDQICGVKTIGYQAYKQPKAVKEFYVKFRDDENNVYDVPVSESMYEGFEKGQRGILTLIGGQIDSFVLDEEEFTDTKEDSD